MTDFPTNHSQAIARRSDVTLDLFRRVAWEGQSVSIDPEVLPRIAQRRDQMLAFIAANPDRKLYGVNIHAGDGAMRRMTPDEQRDYGRGLHSGTSFGEPLPRRVARGMVLARLTNFIEGHAGVSPETTIAVVEMLNESELPEVPRTGNGGSGEIQALGWLFADIPERVDLGVKEGMALINGSPCQAALLADVVLAARGYLNVAQTIMCLAAEAVRVRTETYHKALEELWSDPFETRSLRAIRDLLEGGDAERREIQPPVSFRIMPRVFGAGYRAIEAGRQAAEISLSAVSDNPVFLFPEMVGGVGDIVSNGGFHNGKAAQAIDAISVAFADICQVAQHQVQRIQQDPTCLPEMDSLALGTMYMVGGGFAEDARAAVVPSVLGLSGIGQSDVPSMAFAAWNRFDRVRRALGGSLTCLAALASQEMARPERKVPPALEPTLERLLAVMPVIGVRRDLGRELDAMCGSLHAWAATDSLEMSAQEDGRRRRRMDHLQQISGGP